jgi:hypothetical protein
MYKIKIAMIVLRRVEFENIRVGCCGLSRYDSITPVGYEADFDAFKKEACEIMRDYGQESYNSPGDEYSLEYFEGNDTEQNFRENGSSIFKFALEKGVWNFYDKGKLQFTVDSPDKLKEIWRL